MTYFWLFSSVYAMVGWLFGRFCFFGISNLVGYLKSNPVDAYILYIWFVNKLFLGNILNKPELICLHIVQWFQVLLSNTNSFFSIQLNGLKYNKSLNSSIWPIDGTLRDITSPGQSEPESNGDEGVLHIS